jgi:ribonuclease HII
MVAPEPVWQARLDVPASGGAHEPYGFETVSLSVRELQRVVSSLDNADPGIICGLTRDPRKSVREMGYRMMRRGRNLARNEDLFRSNGIRLVAGADEAGRGALAGPLAAAAVLFEPGVAITGVNDSKLLTPEAREELYLEITERAASISVVFVDHSLIDRWGLQLANHKALLDAVAGLDDRCQCVICDHFYLKGCPYPNYGIPTADRIFQSVAAASIVAKVERDRVMISLHETFPQYNFKDNKGYGTGYHCTALSESGPCEVHRLSFRGVAVDREVALWEEDVGGAGG